MTPDEVRTLLLARRPDDEKEDGDRQALLGFLDELPRRSPPNSSPTFSAATACAGAARPDRAYRCGRRGK